MGRASEAGRGTGTHRTAAARQQRRRVGDGSDAPFGVRRGGDGIRFRVDRHVRRGADGFRPAGGADDRASAMSRQGARFSGRGGFAGNRIALWSVGQMIPWAAAALSGLLRPRYADGGRPLAGLCRSRAARTASMSGKETADVAIAVDWDRRGVDERGLPRADDKADIDAAAKKLAESSHAWKTTTEADFGGGESEGKVDKDGLMHVKMSFFNNDVEILKKGEKGAVKTEEGWKSFDEAGQGGQDGQPNPGRFMSRMARTLKTPAETTRQLAQAAKELKKDGDAFKTELTELGAKELMSFGGRRGGGQGPEISDAKGDAQFWIKDGVVSKVKYHVAGTINFNGNEREIDRTVTIEVKDVGSTKVEVPAEAKEKPL